MRKNPFKKRWYALAAILNMAKERVHFLLIIALLSVVVLMAVIWGAMRIWDSDQRQLDGLWTIIDIDDGTNSERFRVFRQSEMGKVLRINGNRITFEEGDDDKSWHFHIDRNRKPGRFELDLGGDVIYSGVYSLEGDVLRIYMADEEYLTAVRIQSGAPDQLYVVLKRSRGR
jgi:uncharacterized protein (TIGR03067 family)